MKRMALAATIGILCATTALAESPIQIRAPIWVYLETVPGQVENKESSRQKPPAQTIDEIARFIMSGMVYGWNFTYVPSDNRRQVKEEFILEPIQSIETNDPRFSVTDLEPEYPRLYCWAQFTMDEATSRRQNYWSSVVFKSGKGRGQAERTDESEGIRKAYIDALRQAVRDRARSLEKNKPKEIRGELLLRDNPRLFADEGRFVAEVRVLINMREIVPYQTF